MSAPGQTLKQNKMTIIKKTLMTPVKNVKGTSDRTPNGYDTWLEYWKAYAKQGYLKCMRSPCNCNGDNLVGAHVKEIRSNNNRWYIVPVCQATNMSPDMFYVEEWALVPVNP